MDRTPDDAAYARLLEETRAQVAALEVSVHARREVVQQAQQTIERLRRRRQRRASPLWEGAQRGAVRTVVLAVGCVLLIAGAATLDGTFGGVAIVGAFGVMLMEGLR